jgi:hypothetical protein
VVGAGKVEKVESIYISVRGYFFGLLSTDVRFGESGLIGLGIERPCR